MENKIIKLAVLVAASSIVIKALQTIKERNNEEEVTVVEAECVTGD